MGNMCYTLEMGNMCYTLEMGNMSRNYLEASGLIPLQRSKPALIRNQNGGTLLISMRHPTQAAQLRLSCIFNYFWLFLMIFIIFYHLKVYNYFEPLQH